MDPDGYNEKAVTAPPAALTNPAPPPYQDVRRAGYPPQPGQGYPRTGQGYPQPGQGYPPQPQGYGNPPQPTVMYVTRPPLAHPVKDYLGYSIFTMLCCCPPLGIAALIYSISARDANLSGNQLVAERSSRTSRTLNHVALGIGLTIFILCIIYFVYVMVAVSAFRPPPGWPEMPPRYHGTFPGGPPPSGLKKKNF